MQPSAKRERGERWLHHEAARGRWLAARTAQEAGETNAHTPRFQAPEDRYMTSGLGSLVQPSLCAHDRSHTTVVIPRKAQTKGEMGDAPVKFVPEPENVTQLHRACQSRERDFDERGSRHSAEGEGENDIEQIGLR